MNAEKNNQAPENWTETPFSMEVSRLSGATVLQLQGSCTMEHADAMTDRLVALASQARCKIIVDMAGLDFIESTGLGGLVSGHLRARKNEGEVSLLAPPPFIHQLLKLTRLTQLFQVFDSIEDALIQP